MKNIRLSAESYVINLAAQHGIRYEETPADKLAVVATRLAGDEVVTDEIEDLIVGKRPAITSCQVQSVPISVRKVLKLSTTVSIDRFTDF